MADTQLYHLGELLKAALNAATAGTVDTAYPYRLPASAPWTRHPCLELYRENETFVGRGNTSQRLREVSVKVNYYVGPVNSPEHMNTQAGRLQAVVQLVDDTIEDGYAATYSGGSNLLTLAGIEAIGVKACDYDYAESGGPIEGAYPALSFTVQMIHRYTRDNDGAEPLGRISADVIGAGVDDGVTRGDIVADTSEQDGEDGKITATGTSFESVTAAFTTAHVGWYICVADATNAANNGSHEITARVSGTKVTIGNAVGLVNETGLNWVLSETE